MDQYSSPQKIPISDFTYDLPDGKIAYYPLDKRDESKLLVYKDGNIQSGYYKYLPQHIPSSSLMIFNNTRVMEARLLFKKPTGGQIEIFCLNFDEEYKDITVAMRQKGSVKWNCLVGGANKWKEGQVLKHVFQYNDEPITFEAKLNSKSWDAFLIEFSWDNASLTFAEVLHAAGQIPLPPYIKRATEKNDNERYQTVYAEYDGSVAAPTAGLHFTEELLKSLKKNNVQLDFVTLHVGAGTFKPVKSDTIEDHEMHSEYINVHRTTIQHILSNNYTSLIAVGTTSLRTLESLYWIGYKLCIDETIFDSGIPVVSQWEVYDKKEVVSIKASLEAVLQWMNKNDTTELLAKTQIIIAPGYHFKMIDGLVTNFHQPKSTLLLLVAALIGKDWKKVYDFALANDYRFLSYGDGSLLWKYKG